MSIENRVQRLEDEVQALKTNDVLFESQLSSISKNLDEVNVNVKTGWTQANDTFREQIAQLREDRKDELARQATERKEQREESRWWWTKAFGIATSVLGIVGALATGAYYSLEPAATAGPAPVTIVAPPESIP
jgi:cytidylate kinase